ncbi:2-C-methyl-D-erythritol 2,4-cyclodiphosphate synthase [Patescibacteria group bacterium]|nr:2-C-methyl-D-erythritol 2,4-cyclodiphosphate synthase [Patescibacteria group bacterium]
MNIAIILAAGLSKRAGQNKLFALLGGKPVWQKTYEQFQTHPEIDRIIVVVPKGEEASFPTDAIFTAGGETRMQSFLNGLAAARPHPSDIIIDQSAANPFVTKEEITQVIQAAKEHGAAAVSHQAIDTITLEKDGFYEKSIPRQKVRLMQTPQAARFDLIQAANPPKDATDLTTALLPKTRVKLIPASPQNKKITFPEDFRPTYFIGEDSHRFSNKGQLTLGGLIIPELPALKANSDGDVIFHAIGRALAQANAKEFSSIADPLCEKGEKSSIAYLKPLLKNIKIQHISLQLECASPRVSSLPLADSIAKSLKIHKNAVSLAVMTGEDLSPFGRGEGIRCTCILTISKWHTD